MPTQLDTWSDVRIFVAVARHGSTLAAAKTLNVTQTTVSRRVQCLEEALGVPLSDDDPALVRCHSPPVEMQAPFWMLISRNAYARPVVRSFIAFAAEEIGPRMAAIQDRDRGITPAQG